MAKGKKEKKRKSRKDQSATIEVAGVKVPKPLRKAGKAALKAAQNPAVGETVAAALLAAAAALREGRSVRDGARAAGVAATDAVDQATRDLTGLASTLRAVAIDVARKTIDAWAAAEDGENAQRQGKKAPAATGGGAKAPAAAAKKAKGRGAKAPAAAAKKPARAKTPASAG